MLLIQQTQVQLAVVPKIYTEVADINQWRWLEGSGQRLDDVDRTHPVLARIKNQPFSRRMLWPPSGYGVSGTLVKLSHLTFLGGKQEFFSINIGLVFLP